MPELPEVEVVRRGLVEHVLGRKIVGITVTGARSVRRQLGGAMELRDRLDGHSFTAVHRRGKYLWLATTDPDNVLLVHLGMSGQMLVTEADAPLAKHTHIRCAFEGGTELRFVDQRTFGGWTVVPAVPDPSGSFSRIPGPVAHVAPDPFDPAFSLDQCQRRIRSKSSEVKRVLLNQTVISGIGNIYADEALWRAQVHGRRKADQLRKAEVEDIVTAARAVMASALEQGGTSFDRLYVNVNGASGYFERSLSAYGQQGRPCPRCHCEIAREQFMNRSSFFCPSCQPSPRPHIRKGAKNGLREG